MSLESDQFCADFTNVFIETKRKFCQLLLLLFFLEGGGGGMVGVSLCNNNNNRNIDYS